MEALRLWKGGARVLEVGCGNGYYAERLREVDTSHVPPTPYPLPLTNVLRADEPGPCLSNEEALANAPDRADGFFRVKAYFDE